MNNRSTLVACQVVPVLCRYRVLKALLKAFIWRLERSTCLTIDLIKVCHIRGETIYIYTEIYFFVSLLTMFFYLYSKIYSTVNFIMLRLGWYYLGMSFINSDLFYIEFRLYEWYSFMAELLRPEERSLLISHCLLTLSNSFLRSKEVIATFLFSVTWPKPFPTTTIVLQNHVVSL